VVLSGTMRLASMAPPSSLSRMFRGGAVLLLHRLALCMFSPARPPAEAAQSIRCRTSASKFVEMTAW
jgi:hypothetical protein